MRKSRVFDGATMHRQVSENLKDDEKVLGDLGVRVDWGVTSIKSTQKTPVQVPFDEAIIYFLNQCK